MPSSDASKRHKIPIGIHEHVCCKLGNHLLLRPNACGRPLCAFSVEHFFLFPIAPLVVGHAFGVISTSVLLRYAPSHPYPCMVNGGLTTKGAIRGTGLSLLWGNRPARYTNLS